MEQESGSGTWDIHECNEKTPKTMFKHRLSSVVQNHWLMAVRLSSILKTCIRIIRTAKQKENLRTHESNNEPERADGMQTTRTRKHRLTTRPRSSGRFWHNEQKLPKPKHSCTNAYVMFTKYIWKHTNIHEYWLYINLYMFCQCTKQPRRWSKP